MSVRVDIHERLGAKATIRLDTQTMGRVPAPGQTIHVHGRRYKVQAGPRHWYPGCGKADDTVFVAAETHR